MGDDRAKSVGLSIKNLQLSGQLIEKNQKAKLLIKKTCGWCLREKVKR